MAPTQFVAASLPKQEPFKSSGCIFFSGVWYYSLAPTLCDITSDLQVWQKEGGVHLKCAWFLPFGVWRIQQKLGELRRQSVLLVSFLQAL